MSAAGALLCESLLACFLSARIALGLELSADTLFFGVAWKAPGVSEAPGVPGVRTLAAADGGTLFGPPGEGTCAQALHESNAATGNATIDMDRRYTVLSFRTSKRPMAL